MTPNEAVGWLLWVIDAGSIRGVLGIGGISRTAGAATISGSGIGGISTFALAAVIGGDDASAGGGLERENRSGAGISSGLTELPVFSELSGVSGISTVARSGISGGWRTGSVQLRGVMFGGS